jgi:hypothetical protein
MNSRKEQIGMNETLFREINERLEELNKTFSEFTDKMELVCECGIPTCIERFAMDVSQYERLRADPTTFAVKRGHELPDLEEVIEEHEHYLVVRKKPGEPAAVAVAEDPRS